MNTYLRHIFFLLIYLSIIFPLIGQDELNNRTQLLFMNAFREGDQYLSAKKYRKAQKSFEKVIELKPKMAAAYRRLGVIHEILGEHQVAADYFEQCIEVNPELSRALYFQSGEMLMRVENYPQALKRLKEYQNFQDLPPESFENGELELSTEAYYNTLIDTYIANCQFAAHKISFIDVTMRNLGGQINSPLDESFPYLANDESWMFYTRNIPLQEEDKLMFSKAESEQWTKGKHLLKKQSKEDFNQGMGKVSRDESIMFFPGFNFDGESESCDILKATMRKSEILDIKKLDSKVNSSYWDSQPTINCDGRSLYFVSNRPGGYGGTDIWVSHLQKDGSWTEAINLGEKINTPMDEESPFIADDNVTLYFASNGHPGFGDMDIFYVRNSEDGYWSDPQNLGKPVNSAAREISFFMNARGDKGYVASERAGGFGGLDIYEFNMPPKKDFEEIAYVKGQVLDAVTRDPVESVVYITEKGNYKTDKAGKFFVCFPTLSKLKVLVSERKYYDYQHDFELTNWNQEGFVELEILLEPLNRPMNLPTLSKDLVVKSPEASPEKLNTKQSIVKGEELPTEKIYTTSDVYFYFDDFSLTKEARYNIDRLIDDIDSEKLALILIEGYADQIGTDDYNQRLSEKRAEEVADYFKSKGIKNLKIKYVGYGEGRANLSYSQNRKVEIYVYYKI